MKEGGREGKRKGGMEGGREGRTWRVATWKAWVSAR